MTGVRPVEVKQGRFVVASVVELSRSDHHVAYLIDCASKRPVVDVWCDDDANVVEVVVAEQAGGGSLHLDETTGAVTSVVVPLPDGWKDHWAMVHTDVRYTVVVTLVRRGRDGGVEVWRRPR